MIYRSRRKRKKTLLRLFTLAPLVLVFTLALSSSYGEATASQKAEFNKLLRERNELNKQLGALDRVAVVKIKRGDSAELEHARQITAQDKLDTVSMRLESASVRYGLVIPPLPDRKAIENDTSANTLNRRTANALARGRTRAMDLIREETIQFLGSIDFSTFLVNPNQSPSEVSVSADAE